MKAIFVFLLLISYTQNINAQIKNEVFFSQQIINLIGDDTKLLNGLACLSKKERKSGVHFVSVDDLHISDSIKQIVKVDRHNFFVQKTDKNIYFGCYYPESYRAAYYYFLDKVGFKFLGVHQNWIIKPRILNYESIHTKLVKRRINSIYVGYTGGVRFDDVDYELYNKRNFLTKSYANAKHDFSSTTFYRENKTEIDLINQCFPNDPVLFDGNRIPNLDNPETMKLIKRWALKRVDSGRYPFGFSVAPSDGIKSGFQKEYNPQSLPMISNLYEIGWYVSIEVAKYIAQARPNYKGKILMSAYGDGPLNVRPPKFKIPSNMSIQLIPYAFQTYYMNDREMFDDWINKQQQDNFSIQVYDYWSPTIWTKNGLPYQDLKQTVNDRLSVWKDYPFKHLTIESTGFMVITYPYLYAYGRYNQNVSDSSFNELLDEYFLFTYGAAADSIKELYFTVFSRRVQESDLAVIYQIIDKASSENDDPEVAKRIEDLKGYANYLYAYFQNKKIKSSQSFSNLLAMANAIKDKGFIQHTTLIATNYGDINPNKIKFSNKNVEFDVDVNELFSQNKKLMTPAAKYVEKPLSKNLVYFQTSENYTFEPYTSELNIFEFKPRVNQLVNFEFAAKQNAKIRIVSESQKIDEIISFDKGEKSYQFFVKANHLYQIEINSYFQSFTLPKTLLFRIKNHRRRRLHSQMKYYFYVPKYVKEIIYDSKDKDARFKFGETLMYPISPSGEVDKIGNPIELRPGIFKYEVPIEHRGKVWMTNQQHYDFEFLNFETIIAKQKFKLN